MIVELRDDCFTFQKWSFSPRLLVTSELKSEARPYH